MNYDEYTTPVEETTTEELDINIEANSDFTVTDNTSDVEDINIETSDDFVMDVPLEIYEVYIRVNDDSVVVDINTGIFISDKSKWLKLDEGTGDRYHHSQGNYLDNGLVDDNGIYNYKFIDGVLVLRTDEEKQPVVDKLNAQAEINQLKAKLLATDYISNKIAEGAATKEEYAEQIAQRAAWRARINELEELL